MNCEAMENAHQQGRDAFAAGLSEDDNPFRWTDDDHLIDEWSDGFDSARAQHMQAKYDLMLSKANMFADGEVGAVMLNNGPETGFKPGWWPTVARKRVNCGDRHPTPPEGFVTHAEALDCAETYKAMSREWLESQ